MLECVRFDDMRNRAQDEAQIRLNIENIVAVMLQSQRKWTYVSGMTEEITRKKDRE